MPLQEELEQQGNWLFQNRSLLPLIILTFGFIVYLLTEIYPETFFLRGTPYEFYYEMICLLISIAGLAIRVYTIGHTPKNTSGRNQNEQVADTINSTGIYSTVRHPLYVGNFFMWLGPALLTGNFWFVTAFCLFYWIYYERIMYAEEQFLRKKFGTMYLNWAENVPAFFPSLKNFIKPEMPFSWKKVLKKEKNGLFAIFLIFCFFDISGELINKGNSFNFFLIGACVLTGLSYLVLKYFKNKTSLLDEKDR